MGDMVMDETQAERLLGESADVEHNQFGDACDIGRDAIKLLRVWKMTAEQCGMGLAEWDAAVDDLLARATEEE